MGGVDGGGLARNRRDRKIRLPFVKFVGAAERLGRNLSEVALFPIGYLGSPSLFNNRGTRIATEERPVLLEVIINNDD